MTTKTTDGKGLLSLGERFTNRTVIVEEIDGTEVRITLTRVVPEREMSLHENRSAAAAVSRGLAEARAGYARRSPKGQKGQAPSADTNGASPSRRRGSTSIATTGCLRQITS